MCNGVLNTNKVVKLNRSKLWKLGEELNLKLSNKLTKGALRSQIMSSMNIWNNLDSSDKQKKKVKQQAWSPPRFRPESTIIDKDEKNEEER